MKSQIVWIDYTNWRNVRHRRRVMPRRIEFTSTQWHIEPQWILVALDIEKADERNFAMKNIHAWSDNK